jgi:formylglycine-generating enzyme required for sulfatase activity
MARLALGDWLEESGRTEEAELLRLHLRLREQYDQVPEADFERLCQLLQSGVPPVVPEVVNSIGMRLVLIPPGTFWMGSPAEEPERFDDEGPVHKVKLTTPFYLGVFPVTQSEWAAVMGSNPSAFCSSGDLAIRVKGMDTSRHPVETVSWGNAHAFCERLSNLPKEVAAHRTTYRLPTEAEWEYVCRAGLSHKGPFHFGHAITSRLANFDGSSPYSDEGEVGEGEEGPFLDRTTPVDAYPPNAFGVYDLHGNVSEWCSDYYDGSYYQSSPRQSPTGPKEGELRVLRGGSWKDWGEFCRAAFRYNMPPTEDRDDFGFRVVMELAK